MELQPRELSLVFSYLSNADIATACLVCRKWNWMLWRETEQSVLWIPRIIRTLNTNDKQRSQRLSLLLGDMQLKKELKGNTIQEVRETLKLIQSKLLQLTTRVAHGLWTSGEFKYLMRAPTDWRLDRINGWQFFARTDKADKADDSVKTAYRVWWTDANAILGVPFKYGLVAFHGVVDSTDGAVTGQLLNEHGVIVYDGGWSSASGFPQGFGTSFYEETGTIQLRGEFRQSAPHGHSVFYRVNGTKAYDGEWVNGFQHGEGTLYHEDGITESFIGTIHDREPSQGSWFNADGVLVHRGTANEFQQRLQEYQSRHHCTFELTGKMYAQQAWWNCKTCFGDDKNKGVCVSCVKRCHKDHDVHFRGESGFFCDCSSREDPNGRNGCQAEEPCNSDCNCVGGEENSLTEGGENGAGLRFIHDPAGRPLTPDEQQAYLIALMLELQGEGAGVPFNGVAELNPDQREVLLNQVQQALADF